MELPDRYPCQRNSEPTGPTLTPRPLPKRHKAYTFTAEHVGGDVYALTQGGETSLGTRDEIRSRLKELIGEIL